MFRKKHSGREKQEKGDAFQEEKVSELKAAIGPLSGRSLQYCSDACLRRYLRARSWNVEKSKKMLEETLQWRDTYKPEEIRWNQVAVEGETGKVYRASFKDRQGRTVLLMAPAKQNTTGADNQLRHLVYLIENAILNLPEEQEQMVWLIDFTGWSMSNSVPIKTAREAAHILQTHYPERLAAAFLCNPPRIFESFWKVQFQFSIGFIYLCICLGNWDALESSLIEEELLTCEQIVKYFLDPVTFEKVKFVYTKNAESLELMQKNFDPEELPEEFGGRNKGVYDHQEFSKMMEKDDIKTSHAWGLHGKATTHSGNGSAAPMLMTPQAN